MRRSVGMATRRKVVVPLIAGRAFRDPFNPFAPGQLMSLEGADKDTTKGPARGAPAGEQGASPPTAMLDAGKLIEELRRSGPGSVLREAQGAGSAPEARDGPEAAPGSASHQQAKGGDAPAGSAKSGDAKSGEAKAGEARSGERKAGDAKAGDAKSGEVKVGDARSGEMKVGDARVG